MKKNFHYDGNNYHIVNEKGFFDQLLRKEEKISLYIKAESANDNDSLEHTADLPRTLGLIGPFEIYDYQNQYCISIKLSPKKMEYIYLPNKSKTIYLGLSLVKKGTKKWSLDVYLGEAKIKSISLKFPISVSEKIILGKGQANRYWKGTVHYFKLYTGAFMEYKHPVIDSEKAFVKQQFLEIVQKPALT